MKSSYAVWSIKMLRIQYILLLTSDMPASCFYQRQIFRFYQSILWIFINTLSAVFSVRRLVLHSKERTNVLYKRRREAAY